jgi:hypothetical protein
MKFLTIFMLKLALILFVMPVFGQSDTTKQINNKYRFLFSGGLSYQKQVHIESL